MMSAKFDVIVLGPGSAGMTAAFRAAAMTGEIAWPVSGFRIGPVAWQLIGFFLNLCG